MQLYICTNKDLTHFDLVWLYLKVHNPNWNKRKSMECCWTETEFNDTENVLKVLQVCGTTGVENMLCV